MNAAKLVKQLLEGEGSTKDLLVRGKYPVTIEFKATEEAAESLRPLLLAICALGMSGSSRSIAIEDHDEKFFFDGDGASAIDHITFNGEPIQQLQTPSYDEDPESEEAGGDASVGKPSAPRASAPSSRTRPVRGVSSSTD